MGILEGVWSRVLGLGFGLRRAFLKSVCLNKTWLCREWSTFIFEARLSERNVVLQGVEHVLDKFFAWEARADSGEGEAKLDSAAGYQVNHTRRSKNPFYMSMLGDVWGVGHVSTVQSGGHVTKQT